MNSKEAEKITKDISEMLDCHGEVYDFDDETLYINTGEDALDFASLQEVDKKYRLEAVNIDDNYDGFLILQIDLRS